MIYSGTFVKLVDSKSGDRKDGKGTWQMATFLVRDKDINLFEVWGEEVDRVRELKDGDKVSLEFNPSTREFNGKYYVSLKVWKVLPFQGEVKEDVKSDVSAPKTSNLEPQSDDLPF